MTTVPALVAILESGFSIREAGLQTGATRELATAVFTALVDQSPMPEICSHCHGTGAKDGDQCKGCRGCGRLA